ncbi:MAG: UDP-N-acetylmuramoyl-tripeptide--D-alanyl-D-alanine ligase [Alphaproteobacteria bacterium MarineAlpha11_Bin1]|nr:MAG: UDP-N-acetylmuramoyl-tripeptide--D-alanyl-D-alanine ligase [Alphaproteobacteria bacterium MarineAlpha11_Bin1]|tara:strand:+ start:318 stop:1727 length:1410 start_codon:yes stop_codon:yes gene_type:complete
MTGVLWTSAEAATATGGTATSDWAATGISIDTRTLDAGDLFIALTGPNFDGNDFVNKAFEAGASAALVKRGVALESRPGLIADDTLQAMESLAVAARARSDAKIAAITGSVGKTGTKEALAHVLSSQGEASYSRGNLNNHWGVPLSAAQMPANTNFGIFEIGMNRAGEIKPLVGLIKPHVAVITAIASAHREFFESVEGIARAKGEIFSSIDGGIAVISHDTEYFSLLSDMALDAGAGEIVSFGQHSGADMRLIDSMPDTTGCSIDALWRGEPISYRLEQPGIHWAHNSLAVLATAEALGADMQRAANDLATIPTLPRRGVVHIIPWEEGTIRLIDDSYNANPESMNAALMTLGLMQPEGGRRVAIIGDMLELGDTSYAAHASLKDSIERNGVDTVFLVGTEMTALANELDSNRISATADTAAALMPAVMSGLKAGDVVTVKASNGTGLSQIVDALTEPETFPITSNRN